MQNMFNDEYIIENMQIDIRSEIDLDIAYAIIKFNTPRRYKILFDIFLWNKLKIILKNAGSLTTHTQHEN